MLMPQNEPSLGVPNFQQWASWKTDQIDMVTSPMTPQISGKFTPRKEAEENEHRIIIPKLSPLEEQSSWTPKRASYTDRDIQGSSRSIASRSPGPRIANDMEDMVTVDYSKVSNATEPSEAMLKEKVKGLKKEMQGLRDRVHELESLEHRQKGVENRLLKKVNTLEQLVNQLISNKLGLVTETSKALSLTRSELARLNLCNNEPGSSTS